MVCWESGEGESDVDVLWGLQRFPGRQAQVCETKWSAEPTAQAGAAQGEKALHLESDRPVKKGLEREVAGHL